MGKHKTEKELSVSEKKIMRQRLDALQLAEELGNVTRVCRERGISRTQFYEYKRRFQSHGFEGLRDLPPIHKSHPQTTPPEVESRILELSQLYPSKGCGYIEHLLKLEGKSCSKPIVQKILTRNGLGSKYERLLALESSYLSGDVELTGEQVKAVEKANPVFRERHVESSRPGELLCQDTLHVGRISGVGSVYMQSVVDTYGSYAFGYLHTGKYGIQSAVVIHNEVLPFYESIGLPVDAILTDNGREYSGTPEHPYELYLELNDIEHRKTKINSPQTNGFVERFNRTVTEEFFNVAFRKKVYTNIDQLQNDLNSWLKFYNYERPHQGYRNLGKRPVDTLNMFTKNKIIVQKED